MHNNISKHPRSMLDATKPWLFWIPVVFLFAFQFSPTDIYISVLHLQLSAAWFFRITQLFLIVWLLVEPFRRYRNSYTAELAANLLPVEIVLLTVFAQYHFRLAITLVCFCLLIPIAFRFCIRALAGKPAKNPAIKKRRRKLAVSASLVAAVFVLAFPGVAGLFYAAADVPLARPTEKPVISETVKTGEYTVNPQLMLSLGEAEWVEKNADERINILKELLDSETTYLGVPPVPLSGDKLERRTLGTYNAMLRKIEIDYTHLSSSKAMDCVETICHEARHAYQHHVVRTLDWENDDVANGFYFRQARAWKEDFDTSLPDKSYLTYYNQSIEIDAREYAGQRVAYYKKQIQQYTEIENDSDS